jgi:hypothetical protein
VYATAVRELSVDKLLLQPLQPPARDDAVDGLWRFPSVRALRFCVAPSRAHVAALEDALRRCGSRLASVEVGATNDWLACRSAATATLRQRCVDPAALMLAAQHPGLRRFVSHAHIPTAALQRVLRDAHQPFPALTELAVPVEVTDVPTLVALAATAAATLVILHVRVTWPGRPMVRFCAAFAQLVGLEDLSVVWDEWEKMDADDFMGLARLPAGLRRLHLVTDGMYMFHSTRPCIADEHLLAVVARLPRLEDLAMDVSGRFTGDALRGLG